MSDFILGMVYLMIGSISANQGSLGMAIFFLAQAFYWLSSDLIQKRKDNS